MIASSYCLLYCSDLCFTISEWKDIVLAGAATVTASAAIVTAYKAYRELKKYHEEKRKEQELKSIEFTLEQHRRLFEDKNLYSVICLIDNDDKKLASTDMWDAKRTLIVFFEEIQLLINSYQINENVAYYLFGYYAIKARHGKNYCEGIDLQEKYFGLFFTFTNSSQKFLANAEQDPKLIQNLRFSIDHRKQ